MIKQMDSLQLRDFLESKVSQYQTSSFIADDPISIPHRFRNKEDIEIAGFLAAAIAWGNRKAILKSCNIMMDMLDNSPSDFVKNASENEIAHLSSFVYRTFQGEDLPCLIRGLHHIYTSCGGLETLMTPRDGESIKDVLVRLRSVLLPFLSQHACKHIANVEVGSAGKRLNMFLRWMVRPKTEGVDFGLWHGISTSELMLPLDVHSGNTSRALGLIQRKQNDWKAVEEVTSALRQFSPDDPVKYDFALFGLGVYEHFS